MSQEVEVLDAEIHTANPAHSRAVARSGRSPPPSRRIPLATLEHVARELARVYRAMRSGEIDPADGSRYTYTLVSLAKVIETATFEKRIGALEKSIEGGSK